MDYEDSSCESSQGGDQLETAEILGDQVQLPQGIIENLDIFNEVFSASTWKSCLTPFDHAHLLKYLPTFPENDAKEKGITLQRLFNRENFKFGSPFDTFHDSLQRGYLRPDIAHLRRLMNKSQRRQFKDQRKRYHFSLLKKVILDRREVLEAAASSSPGPLKVQRNYLSTNPAGDPVQQRVKKRYFQELAAVRSEVGEYSQSSEDENYSDRAPRTLSKKQRHKLALLESSLASSDMTAVTCTLATKPAGFDLSSHVTNHSNPFEITEEGFKKMLSAHRRKRFSQDKMPDLNSNMSLNDIAIRSEMGQRRGSAKCSSPAMPIPVPIPVPAPVPAKVKRKPSSNSNCSSSPVPKIKSETFQAQPTDFFQQKPYKRDPDTEVSKRSEESTDDELQRVLDRVDIDRDRTTLERVDMLQDRTNLDRSQSESEKNIDVESASPTNILQNQILMEGQSQSSSSTAETVLKPSVSVQTTAAPPSVLTVSPAEEEDVIYNNSKTSQLMQETHHCFFSLLRDIICSSPQHRMRLDKMENKLRLWEANPISPLNEWFSLCEESWLNMLDSALNFLSGDYPGYMQPDDFVPYIEYKPNLRTYQWIGAGRDSDSHLLALCSHWLDHREETLPQVPAEPEEEPDVEEGDCDVGMGETEVEMEGEGEEDPLPRFPTSWTVRPSTEEERINFQKQEFDRFQNPTRAFTYRMHGYESVVGPVKGIYNSQTSASVLKPRGHNLLAHNRPNYVTVLALVRDAAARLPNGEGTRADMCTLIRDSQYLDLTGAGESTLQSVVSGALDRLHYEVDACVRFNVKRKMWIYLHRKRSEAEMEKMHQQYQGVSKTVKKPPRKKQAKKADSPAAGKEKKQAAKPLQTTATTSPAVTGGSVPTRLTAIVEEGEVPTSSSQNQQTTVAVSAAGDLKRSIPQEIITSAGKKILIQTSFAGRAPLKFVATPASGKTITGTLSRSIEGQTSLVKPSTAEAVTMTGTLLKGTVTAVSAAATVTAAGPVTTAASPFIVNNLAGTQFLTASGQKVQIIASSPQNLGQLQSIQLGSGQNILAHNLQATGAGSSQTSNLLQGIQQVQILTSSGQLIARTIGTAGKTTIAGMTQRSSDETIMASVLKSPVTLPRAAVTQLPTTRPAATKNVTSVRMAAVSMADVRPSMSLLTTSQPRLAADKDGDKLKVGTVPMSGKPATKMGAQILNVSGVHLLNKPMVPKNNASVLTGVKLVNTQQGVKMVATSSTTVMQTPMAGQKVTATVAKSVTGTAQGSTSTTIGQLQLPRTNPQIISMEALVQGRTQGNKGQTSLIQLAPSAGGVPQFAVVSQGSIQPRFIQAHHISGMAQGQRTTLTSASTSQAKPVMNTVRMPGNMTLAGVKPVILAKSSAQAQNVILTTDGTGTGQALVLAQPGTRPSGPGTVVMPSGPQQILLPTNFPGGTLNLKNLQGLKVIPISGSGQKVYARFIKNPPAPPPDPPNKPEES